MNVVVQQASGLAKKSISWLSSEPLTGSLLLHLITGPLQLKCIFFSNISRNANYKDHLKKLKLKRVLANFYRRFLARKEKISEAKTPSVNRL